MTTCNTASEQSVIEYCVGGEVYISCTGIKPSLSASAEGVRAFGWFEGTGYFFQCRGVLLICIIVGQGPIALAEVAGGGCLDIFSLAYLFLSFLSFFLPLWKTSQYRLKFCLKGPLNPKQPTNQSASAVV